MRIPKDVFDDAFGSDDKDADAPRPAKASVKDAHAIAAGMKPGETQDVSDAAQGLRGHVHALGEAPQVSVKMTTTITDEELGDGSPKTQVLDVPNASAALVCVRGEVQEENENACKVDYIVQTAGSQQEMVHMGAAIVAALDAAGLMPEVIATYQMQRIMNALFGGKSEE